MVPKVCVCCTALTRPNQVETVLSAVAYSLMSCVCACVVGCMHVCVHIHCTFLLRVEQVSGGVATASSSGSSAQTPSESVPIRAPASLWRCSRIMHLLRDLHPTLLSALEGIVDQVRQPRYYAPAGWPLLLYMHVCTKQLCLCVFCSG